MRKGVQLSIGARHRPAARLDDRYDIADGALSSRPEIAKRDGFRGVRFVPKVIE